MVRLERIVERDWAEVWVKLEAMNPGGSIKDRPALAMIVDAERRGVLRPGDTIVEPTSGNTGIGLAQVAAARGYKLILTLPAQMSIERKRTLTGYGAKLVLTDPELRMIAAIAEAEKIRDATGAFMPDLDRAGCILYWGYNPSVARLVHATQTLAALKRGARLIVVDPRRALEEAAGRARAARLRASRRGPRDSASLSAHRRAHERRAAERRGPASAIRFGCRGGRHCRDRRLECGSCSNPSRFDQSHDGRGEPWARRWLPLPCPLWRRPETSGRCMGGTMRTPVTARSARSTPGTSANCASRGSAHWARSSPSSPHRWW